eukprot:gene9552-12865_t
MSRIVIKNLGNNILESHLKETFSRSGEITDIHLPKTKDGKTRRIAFIGYRNESQAAHAIKYFNNTFIGLSKITVDNAKVKNTNYEVFKQNFETNIQYPDKKASNANLKSTLTNNAKSDYLEVMKKRNDSKFWANDESLLNLNSTSATNNTKIGEIDDEDSGINSVGGDSSDDSSINSLRSNDNKNEGLVNQKMVANPLEYLKSKVSSKFSDDDEDDEMEIVVNEDGKKIIAKKNKIQHQSVNLESKDDDIVSIDDQPNISNDDMLDKTDDEHEDSSRLYVTNLPFTCTEDDFSEYFSTYGTISEVHIPLNTEKKSRGYGFIQFLFPESAEKAMKALSGIAFQGRVINIVKAKTREVTKIDDSEVKHTNRLSSFKQAKEEERRKHLNQKEGWNASFIRSDTVVDSLADRYGVSRSDIMDSNASGGDVAVRLAIGETQIIQENADFFASHGININALESNHSKQKVTKRSTTTILVKNLPYDMVPDELESMFTKYGALSSFLVPKSKSMALVDFNEPSEARAAYKGLAYRNYKHVPIYLEWAPVGLMDKSKIDPPIIIPIQQLSNATQTTALSSTDMTNIIIEDDISDEYSTLFIKNLNFITEESVLVEHLCRLGVQGLRKVSIQKKQVGQYLLSQGYGFAEFDSFSNAEDAQKRLNGSTLDSHTLQVKPSDKRLTKQMTHNSHNMNINENKKEFNKLIVRNLAFQATKSELRSLFAVFGSVKRVRIPKKMGGDHRGFAFIDFSTSQEAASAMASLKNTHLYGRHLVIEYAKDDEDENNNRNIGGSNFGDLSPQKFAHQQLRVASILVFQYIYKATLCEHGWGNPQQV